MPLSKIIGTKAAPANIDVLMTAASPLVSVTNILLR